MSDTEPSYRIDNPGQQPSAEHGTKGLDDVYAGLAKLHEKVDSFFAVVARRQHRAMVCQAGCSSCCHRMPGVFPVEAWFAAETLRSMPLEQAKKVVQVLTPYKNKVEVSPCALLDKRGRCQLYTARPIICRSHGLPIQVPGQNVKDFDSCPLNFSTPGLRAQVDATDVLDVERLNEILTVVDGLFHQSCKHPHELPVRMPLATGILYFLSLGAK